LADGENKMRTTAKQDQDFLDAIFSSGNSLLELAIEWIHNNMEPDEVFTEDQLNEWVKRYE
jgi:hypothetical protein